MRKRKAALLLRTVCFKVECVHLDIAASEKAAKVLCVEETWVGVTCGQEQEGDGKEIGRQAAEASRVAVGGIRQSEAGWRRAESGRARLKRCVEPERGCKSAPSTTGPRSVEADRTQEQHAVRVAAEAFDK